MASNPYPEEHTFLLGCSESSDFFTEVRACFEKEDELLAQNLPEELEKLSKSLDDYRQGHDFIISLDPDTLNYSISQSFLTRYREINSYLRSISDSDFESLCAYYVGLLGCEDFRVTRRSSDQGLDFYGTIPYDRSSFFDPITEKSFLIGQAKLYTSKVGTPEIREFIGSIELLKRKIFSSDKYSYQFASSLKYFSVITPIFISSSSFTKDAKEVCLKAGVRMVDAVKLIALLTTVDRLFDSDSQLIPEELTNKISSVQTAESN